MTDPTIEKVLDALAESATQTIAAAQNDAVEAQAAAQKALDAIKLRSYADRLSLPKMINCPVCDLRHRGPQCKQVFTKDKDDLERMCELSTRNGYRGQPLRVNFSKPRFNKHPNRRQLAVIRYVRRELPDEYTQEELAKIRAKAFDVVYKPNKPAVPTTPKKVNKDGTVDNSKG